MKVTVKFITDDVEERRSHRRCHYRVTLLTPTPSPYERWPGERPAIGDPFALDCDESACRGEKKTPLDPTGRQIVPPAPLH